MRRSCDRIDRKNGRYDKNGHSPFYGDGRLNGGKAVALAQSTKGDRIRITRQRVLPASGSLVIPFHVGEQARMQGLIVRVGTLRPAGRMALTLRPPRQSRTRRIVLNDGTAAVGAVTQTFGSAGVPGLSRLRNKSAKGLWQLEVRAADRGAAMPMTCSLELALKPGTARRRRRREPAQRSSDRPRPRADPRGTDPHCSTTSWNAAMSNRRPAFWAAPSDRLRSSRNFSMPIV